MKKLVISFSILGIIYLVFLSIFFFCLFNRHTLYSNVLVQKNIYYIAISNNSDIFKNNSLVSVDTNQSNYIIDDSIAYNYKTDETYTIRVDKIKDIYEDEHTGMLHYIFSDDSTIRENLVLGKVISSNLFIGIFLLFMFSLYGLLISFIPLLFYISIGIYLLITNIKVSKKNKQKTI